MKHAEMAAHSSGRSGGESLVFECPLIGVLQMIATATVLKCIAHIVLYPGVLSGKAERTLAGRCAPRGNQQFN
jgi:hypothetical protein